jgi:hypothetical protein
MLPYLIIEVLPDIITVQHCTRGTVMISVQTAWFMQSYGVFVRTDPFSTLSLVIGSNPCVLLVLWGGAGRSSILGPNLIG